ncbi:hypothetical protein AVEN_201899-1, partial [Araneus ventricosus]
CSFYYT